MFRGMFCLVVGGGSVVIGINQIGDISHKSVNIVEKKVNQQQDFPINVKIERITRMT